MKKTINKILDALGAFGFIVFVIGLIAYTYWMLDPWNAPLVQVIRKMWSWLF